MSWKQLSSKEIFRNRWMWLTEDEVQMDNGEQATYTVMHKKPFALIIPWEGEKFTLVGQYRYNVNFNSWEFPQGHYEHNSIQETAQKELKEETGYTADEIKLINSFFIAPGAIDQECMVFLATGLHKGEQELEDTEYGLKNRSVTLEQMNEMINKGEIKDGPTITALSLLLAGNYLS